MNILVTSYYFYPENTPRAFRTYELIKEFARQGHAVDVYIPDKGYDYSDLEFRYGFKTVKVKPGFLLNKARKRPSRDVSKMREGAPKKVSPLKSNMLKFRRKAFLSVYFDDRATEYSVMLAGSLLSEKKNYDAVISVGLPFAVHIGTAIALSMRKKLAAVRIADYGDPFSKNRNRSETHLRGHFWLEKLVLRAFDYITVPIDEAVGSFLDFKDKDRIRVIPQGVDLNEVKTAEYRKNKIPTFIYGGNFYSRLRNPEKLLDFMASVDTDFRFIIYTDTMNSEHMDLLRPYIKKMGARLDVRQFVPRLDFIREASKADFLLNLNNLSSNQLPSKLIDYALSGRPILSCDTENFSPELFMEFLRGEYDGGLKVDIHEYEISGICKKFIDLI